MLTNADNFFSGSCVRFRTALGSLLDQVIKLSAASPTVAPRPQWPSPTGTSTGPRSNPIIHSYRLIFIHSKNRQRSFFAFDVLCTAERPKDPPLGSRRTAQAAA